MSPLIPPLLHPLSFGMLRFHFHWSLKCFLISLAICSLTHWLCDSVEYRSYKFVNFAVFLLLLISNFVQLQSENTHQMASSSLNVETICGLTHGLSWRMFHVCLRRTCCYWAECSVYVCWIWAVSCVARVLYFLPYVWWLCPYWERGTELSCRGRTVFLPRFCPFLLCMFWRPVSRHVNAAHACFPCIALVINT